MFRTFETSACQAAFLSKRPSLNGDSYNKNLIKPGQISRYEDLADTQWQGKILVRSSNNVYNQSLVGSILAALGEPRTEGWIKGVVANLARKPEGNDVSQIKAVVAGMGALTVANTYYLARLAASDNPENRAIADKIGVIFPNQSDRGTHINTSGGGIDKYAPHRSTAIQYLEYLASPEAQQIFASSNYEYPVVQGVPKHPVLERFGDFKQDALNAKVFGEKNGAALRLMDRAGWT